MPHPFRFDEGVMNPEAPFAATTAAAAVLRLSKLTDEVTEAARYTTAMKRVSIIRVHVYKIQEF